MNEKDAQAGTPVLTEDQTKKLVQTGQLFHTLAADPKYRTKVLGLIKEAAPDTYIPELEVAGEVERKVEARVKPFEDSTAELTKQVAELNKRIARQDWASKSGLTEDELVEVEELAKEGGITKGETAIEHWRMRNQLGTPRATPAAKESDEYLAKLRKVNPKDVGTLKRLAVEHGTTILRQSRSRRAS